MKQFTLTFVPAIGLALAISTASWAQTAKPQAAPCTANPSEPNGKSLSGRLADCNGVLIPPKVGDGEIVEPAPEGGTLRVIPPSTVLGQQSGSDGGDHGAPVQQQGAGYDIAAVVDAVSNAGEATKALASLNPQRIDVYDISILLSGSNAAVLNASLNEHAEDVEALRKAVAGNPMLAAAVAAKGLAVMGVVGAAIGEDKSVTLFGR